MKNFRALHWIIFAGLAFFILACSLFNKLTQSGSNSEGNGGPGPIQVTPLGSGGNSGVTSVLKIIAISANSNRNLALDNKGRVWQWGNYKVGPGNSPCQGGDACLTTPSLVTQLSDVIAISAGYDHYLALKADGSVWAWGKNENYQLGQGMHDAQFHQLPLQVPGLREVIALSASDNFSLALKQDGTLWAWGDNGAGELGDGKDSYTPDYSLHEESPFQVVGLADVTAIATGFARSMALRRDGTVWTWGFNQFGELGQGSADSKQHATPAQVPGLAGVKAIAAGFNNAMAVKNDGSVWMWGANLGMQMCLGQYDVQPHPSPQQVALFSGAQALAVASMQSMALKSDGSVWVCGMMGKETSSLTGMAISGLPKISAISAGEDHELALDEDGGVWAWGDNNVGQLGDGTTTTRWTPGKVLFPAD